MKPWAKVMGEASKLISDIQHMVRAICTNPRTGKKQASGGPISILDADADAPAVPKAKGPKKKPRLVNIPILATSSPWSTPCALLRRPSFSALHGRQFEIDPL